MPLLPRTLKRFLHDESGPTAAEYAVMIAMILTLCIGSITGLGFRIQALVASLQVFMSQVLNM